MFLCLEMSKEDPFKEIKICDNTKCSSTIYSKGHIKRNKPSNSKLHFIVLVTIACLVFLPHMTLTLSPLNIIDVKSSLTNKEKCVSNILAMYRNNYIKYIVKLRTRLIKRLYIIERKNKYWRQRTQQEGTEDKKSDWSRGINDEARTDGRRLLNKLTKDEEAAFIKKMGDKVKIFGKVFTEKEIKRPAEILADFKKHWIITLLKGQTFNRESKVASNIQSFLVNQFNLHRRYKSELRRCFLNEKPSMERCESMYGKNSCELLYSGVVHKRCPEGTQRVGCCSCAAPCPSKFYKSENYFCLRSQHYYLDRYSTQAECQQEHKICSQLGNLFYGNCITGFTREAETNICKVNCPAGWAIHDGKCIKPNITSLGTPFVWIKSDN